MVSLLAIAAPSSRKARLWMDEITNGASFAVIAQREGKSERQIRLLAPLAFVPPITVRTLIEGTARAGTVTDLAKKRGPSLERRRITGMSACDPKRTFPRGLGLP